MKIMIDPGHYTDHVNQSPIDLNYYESKTVWDLALYLQKELRAKGVIADLTRNDIDENPGLVERGEKSKGYDLFISIHTNSTGDGKPSDTADFPVCFTQLSGAVDDLADIFLDKLGKMFGSKYPGYKQAEDNGYGQDKLGVLRGAANVGTPGILVEHGFHTNKYNLRDLENQTFLKNLAIVDAGIIIDWVNSKKDIVVPPNATSLYGVVKGVPDGDPGLNVRLGPGTGYSTIEKWPLLGNGNKVDILGRNNDQTWVYIRIAGQYFGWVNAHYISLS